MTTKLAVSRLWGDWQRPKVAEWVAGDVSGLRLCNIRRMLLDVT